MLSWDTSEMQSELWDRQLKYQDLRRDVFPEKMLDHISGYVCDRNVRIYAVYIDIAFVSFD